MVIDTKKLLKAVVKNDGNHTKAAKELGIRQQSVTRRVNKNPAIKKAILNVREEALKKAGLSRAFVYKGIKEGCKATVIADKSGTPFETDIADHSVRKHFLRIALELHKDLEPDKEQSVQNIGAIIFQVLHNPNRQRIDVV